MYTTYILYDLHKDRFYIGQTGNLADRLKRHFNNRSKYTKNGLWKLVYQESFVTRSEAIFREKYLKSLKSKVALRNIMGQ